MTALSVPARPEEDASLRPVPWQRMGWVTWRQHRATLAWVIVFLGVLAVAMWQAGRQLHSAYATALAACQPPVHSLACPGATIAFDGTNGFLGNGFLLQAVPVLIGAFAGAPVLARELETGTFRYAWTQAFGRWRWTLAKLVPLAVALAAVAGVFSLVFEWYYQPYFVAANQNLSLTEYTPFFPGLFDLRGIGFAAWTLVAFAIGALAGTLIRRVVPAIAATLVAYTGLAFAAGDVAAPGLYDAGGHQQRERARLRVGHEPVVDQRRQVRLFRLALRPPPQPVLPSRPGWGGAWRQAEGGRPRGVSHPARLHAVDQLSAGQPVLAVPVDRGRLAARAVGPTDRRDRVAGPPPGDLRSHRGPRLLVQQDTRFSGTARRDSSSRTPGPDSWLTAAERPVSASRIAAIGPSATRPSPADQQQSVAANLIPPSLAPGAERVQVRPYPVRRGHRRGGWHSAVQAERDGDVLAVHQHVDERLQV